jgi:hypothetical protein
MRTARLKLMPIALVALGSLIGPASADAPSENAAKPAAKKDSIMERAIDVEARDTHRIATLERLRRLARDRGEGDRVREMDKALDTMRQERSARNQKRRQRMGEAWFAQFETEAKKRQAAAAEQRRAKGREVSALRSDLRSRRQALRADVRENRQEFRQARHAQRAAFATERREQRQDAREQHREFRQDAREQRHDFRADRRDSRQDARSDRRDNRHDARSERRDHRKDARSDRRDNRQSTRSDRRENRKDARSNRQSSRSNARSASGAKRKRD